MRNEKNKAFIIWIEFVKKLMVVEEDIKFVSTLKEKF